MIQPGYWGANKPNSFGIVATWCLVLTIVVAGGVLVPSTQAYAQSRITEKENKLYLAVDIDREHFASGWDSNYSTRSFHVRVIASSGYDPRAEITYVELAPGYFFPRISGPQEISKFFNFFGGAPVTPQGGKRQHVGKTEFEYILTRHRNRECAVFVDPDGQGGGDGQTSDGTSFIAGYWCAPSSETLSTKVLVKVLDAIGTKEAGSSGPGLVSLKETSPRTATGRSATDSDSGRLAGSESKADLETGDAAQRLKKAKQLFEQGLITQDEYADIRRKILKDL